MGKIFGHVQQGSEYNNSHSQRGMHGYDSASDGVAYANDDSRSHFTALLLLHALVIVEVLNGLLGCPSSLILVSTRHATESTRQDIPG
jgi:hypothetical protein